MAQQVAEGGERGALVGPVAGALALCRRGSFQGCDDGRPLGFGAGLVVLGLEDRLEAFAQVPFDVIGQHAQEEMGSDPGRQPAVDRPDLQVDAFERAKGALDLGQGLVAFDQFLGAHGLLRQVGADDIEAVEPGLGFDGLAAALVGEAVAINSWGDGALEVLGHLVLVDDGTDFEADCGLAAQGAAFAPCRQDDA